MSAPKCFVLFVVIVQLVDNVVKCMPVAENTNAQALMNYRYDNPYFRGYGVSNWGGNRPMPYPGGLGPGFDSNSGYVPIGTGYIPPSGGSGGGSTGMGGFDQGFDGSTLGGGFGGASGGSPSGGGFDGGFDGSQLGGRPSGGFDGGFDGSHLGGSVVQTPNFDVRSGK